MILVSLVRLLFYAVRKRCQHKFLIFPAKKPTVYQIAFLLFVDVFLVVVKSATDKLVPASMIQNKTIFELYRDVVDTMVSNTGGFAAILH
jgi:hypothetical protein